MKYWFEVVQYGQDNTMGCIILLLIFQLHEYMSIEYNLELITSLDSHDQIIPFEQEEHKIPYGEVADAISQIKNHTTLSNIWFTFSKLGIITGIMGTAIVSTDILPTIPEAIVGAFSVATLMLSALYGEEQARKHERLSNAKYRLNKDGTVLQYIRKVQQDPKKQN